VSDPARRQRGSQARRRGRWAEALCVLSLSLRGWRIIGRGVMTGRGTGAGEIDIVARKGRVLAFIEVKARPSRDEAAAAISPAQRRRLVRAAEAFLARRPHLAGLDVRFDAMLVAPGRWPHHIGDAWRAAS
jgi:putative endonuclease